MPSLQIQKILPFKMALCKAGVWGSQTPEKIPFLILLEGLHPSKPPARATTTVVLVPNTLVEAHLMPEHRQRQRHPQHTNHRSTKGEGRVNL